MRKFILSFILGAIGGTFGDFCHVISSTDGYPEAGIMPWIPHLPVHMPIWVPFLFGTATTLIVWTHTVFEKKFTPHLASVKWVSLIAPLFFLAQYACSGFIRSNADYWLGAVSLLFWLWMDRTKIGALIAMGIAFCGICFEILLTHFNIFYYWPGKSQLFGVPTWLPYLYFSASVCLSLFTRAL